jgi:hypothetical protein
MPTLEFRCVTYVSIDSKRSSRRLPMNDLLTLAEIEQRYDAEWVLIEDPELDENVTLGDDPAARS